MKHVDVTIVGGGVIGLMTAWELSRRNHSVALIDRVSVGTEASWAGAGIISPASTCPSPGSRLQRASHEIFPRLAEEIARETGIDVEFRRTGGIEIARSPADANRLQLHQTQRIELGVESKSLALDDRRTFEPALGPVEEAEWMPGYCQVRNPRLLRGLKERCGQQGVSFFECSPIERIGTTDKNVERVDLANGESLCCSHLVCSAGAWSASLLKQHFGISLPIAPIQGQIVVYQAREKLIRHILLEGKKYIVPREDNLILIGATEDNVGFEKKVTAEGVASLRAFAEAICPALADAVVRYSWAGLRPGNNRGLPYLGRPKGWRNLWLATGHYRQGLQQSPGSATLLADWLEEKPGFATEAEFGLDIARSDEGLFES